MSVGLKQKYNILLEREARAENYLNSTNLTIDERMKWYPEFMKILREMNDLLAEIGPCTQQERLNGFAATKHEREERVG